MNQAAQNAATDIKKSSASLGIFILLLVVGAILVVGTVPRQRTRIIQQRIDDVPSLVRDGNVDLALANLLQVRPWAQSYPAMLRQLDCEVIRCHVARKDLRAAWKVASAMFTEEPLEAEPETNRWSLILNPATALWNRYVCTNTPPHSAGLDVLEEELKQRGSATDLAQFRRARNTIEHVVDDERTTERRTAATDTVKQPTAPSRTAALKSSGSESRTPKRPVASLKSPPPAAPPPARVQAPPPAEIDPNLQWGVITTAKAGVYTKKGKRVGDMHAGDIVEVIDVVSTKAGSLAVSEIPDEHGNVQELVIKLANLQLRPGGLATANREEVDLRVARGKLLARMDARRAEIHAARKSRNPYAPEYERQKKRYNDFWEKVKDLQARRDKATGANHIKYADELRKMKGQDIELANTYNAIKKKYKAWMDANKGHGDDEITDQVLSGLMEELAELEMEISRLL